MSFLCPALKAVLKRERVALRRACCVEWILEGILENLDSENHNMFFTLLFYFMRLRNDEQKHEIENVWAAPRNNGNDQLEAAKRKAYTHRSPLAPLAPALALHRRAPPRSGRSASHLQNLTLT